MEKSNVKVTKRGMLASKKKIHRKSKRKPYIFYASQEYNNILNNRLVLCA